MRLTRIGFTGLLLLALTAGCSSLKTSTDYVPGTDFGGFKTFSFAEGAKPRNPVARRSIEYAVALALEGRGFKQMEKGGDLTVFGHFVADTRTQIDSYGYSMTGWYGWGWSAVAPADVRVIPVGTLLLDLVDAKSNKLVWRAMVQDDISTTIEPEEREKKAIRIAKELFAGFPPVPK